MKPSRRALVLSSLIECGGMVVYFISHSFDWPLGDIAWYVLHFPAECLFDSFRLPPVEHRFIAVALLQWLFWFVALGVAFFIADDCRRKRNR